MTLVLKQEKEKSNALALQNDDHNETESRQTSPRSSLDSTNSSESDTNNSSQEQNTSIHQRSNMANTSTPMHDILKLIEENNIAALYENKNLHYFFLKNCVINVVSRKKWRENVTRYVFSRFIHPSDEGFALVVLENNITRYREMRDREKNVTNQEDEHQDNHQDHDYSQPSFTVVTKKGHKSSGKGWSDEGKTKFKNYTIFVKNKRQNKQWLHDRNKAVKRRALRESKDSKKRKRSSDNDTEEDKRMNSSEEKEWNRFIFENVNDTEWLDNVVGV